MFKILRLRNIRKCSWNVQLTLTYPRSSRYRCLKFLRVCTRHGSECKYLHLFWKWLFKFFFPVNMKAELRKKYNVCFDILDLKSFKRSAPNHGWAYIIFILKDGTTYPALHFHNGGSKALLQHFGKFIHIKRYIQVPLDNFWYEVHRD